MESDICKLFQIHVVIFLCFLTFGALWYNLLLNIEQCFTALDAMRKAHKFELQKERNKFLDTLAKTYSQADVESLQRQHE